MSGTSRSSVKALKISSVCAGMHLMHQCRLGDTGQSSFAGKHLGVLQHLLAVQASSILGAGSMNVVGRSKELILLLLDTGRTTSGLLCLHWGFLLGKDADSLEQVQ